MATLLTHIGLDPVPGRGRGDLAARRRAGPGRRRGRVADRPADRDAGPAAGQEPRLRGARASTPASRPTSRPTWPSTRTASRSPTRRSGSTTRCRSAATRSTRTGSGRRPHIVIRDGGGRSRCGTRPVPMTDAAAGLPVRRRSRVPGRDIGLQLLLERASRRDGACCSSLPYRVVGTNADGTPDRRVDLEPVALARGDVDGARRALDFSVELARLRRVHAADRQARPGPGDRVGRVRAA